MNSKQFQYEFGIQLNQLDSALSLSSDDIQYWLNKAQLELVKETFKHFEKSKSISADLQHLITNTSEETKHFNDTITGFEIDRAPIPTDNLYVLNVRASVKYGDIDVSKATGGRRSLTGKTKIVPTRMVQNHKIYSMLDDPFNTTKTLSPISYLNDDGVDIYTDNKFIAERVYFNYLRMPTEINFKDNISSELPKHLHKPIIQHAVDLFLNNTRDLKQRLQRETPNVDSNQTTKVDNNE